ncbi:thiosulfate sulfurtransferase/rhodanese-like domain-containing protein 3 [Tachyglossus aculeatus]|uniref:thiosulfate sulfurtransferase/rhodanese-like domain-containing protein 3 n=1 Tax=Tachyglossus aculeatus TaxID=9261 RepID=UPI0018F798EC|nr:thiosulfate sulfurtransferase/rhodanese-like domain-containing protein 3 [Tachyglossus aculeatus]
MSATGLRLGLLLGLLRAARTGTAGAGGTCRAPVRWAFPTAAARCEGSRCHLCTDVSQSVTYKELKDLLHSKTIVLIDVREVWELKDHGRIPGSINIPLAEVAEALQMNPSDFKDKYHQAMPSKSDSIVFSCLAGVRSKQALATALSLGFKSAQHYPGGWQEWTSSEFPPKKH